MAMAEYDKGWMRAARYGKSHSYAQICAIVHSTTGGKCTCCGKPSAENHHALYSSWWQAAIDIIDMLKRKPVKLPVWQPGGRGEKRHKIGGLTQGREIAGLTCFPVCLKCHDKLHHRQHWLEFDNKIQHCWSARNRWTTLWRLRLLWQLRRVRGTEL